MSKGLKWGLLILVGLIIIGGGAYLYWRSRAAQPPSQQILPSASSTPTPASSESNQPGTKNKASSYPKGIYLMISGGTSTDNATNILSKPFVDGALIGAQWNSVEPSEGKYDWSSIDKYLSIVKSKGKKASLVLFPGKFTPDWVFAKGVQKWNWTDHNGQNVTYPNPTDPKFYEIWKETVKAFGQKYGSDDSIDQVSICGGTGALCGLRFYVLPPNWNATTVVSQWKGMVDTYVSAFPKPDLTFEIQTTVGEGTTLSEQMMEYNFSKYGNKIGPFEEFLSANAPTGELVSIMQKWGPKSNKSWCGFQESKAQGADLDKAYSHGLNDIGCQYFEVYKNDLTDYDSINQKWHDLIWK